ncbi:MAG TPA: MFS transporter [Solirubrobacteraceae bacterium]|nr:MFS transporter [Solirubrobacteraceae bacterium]
MLSSLTRVRFARRPALGTSARLRLVYALFLVAGVAQAAIVPLLPRLAGRYDLSGAQTALLLALPGLATLAVSVPSGLAADRLGARRVTLGAGLLLALACVAQAVPSLPVLLAGRIVFGVAFGVVWTTGMAWLAELDDGSGRSVLGPSVTCSSVGIMLGPAVAGILAQDGGLGAPFAAVAVAAALVLVPLIAGTATAAAGLVDEPRPIDPGDLPPDVAYAQPAVGELRPSVSPRALVAMARRPRVAAAAGALIVSGAVSSASQLLISGGLHTLGLSTGRIGLAFSVAAVAYIAVSAVVVRLGRRAQTLRTNAVTTALLAAALLPAFLHHGVVALELALLLSAGPRAVISTIAYALAAGQRSDSAGSDGVVFGMLNGAWAAATVVMPVVCGALAAGPGARGGYLAVILPCAAIGFWLLSRAGAEDAVAEIPAAAAIDRC